MEEFRKKIENRLKAVGALCACSMALFIVLKIITGGAEDFSRGLVLGLFVGLETTAIYFVAKYTTALKNEEKLREMYINETDERNNAIQKETSRNVMLITMESVALAAVAAGFFDRKICITLAAVLIFGAVVKAVLTAYYNRKM